MDAKGLGQTHLNLSRDLTGSVYQSGALFSYSGRPKQVNIRVGVSFRSAEQACANAESEIGSSSFEDILAKAKALWQEKLSKIEIDIANTPANITEMLYSSLYRASLTPVRYLPVDAFEDAFSQSSRTMLPERRREYFGTRHHSISTRCIAGMPFLLHPKIGCHSCAFFQLGYCEQIFRHFQSGVVIFSFSSSEHSIRF